LWSGVKNGGATTEKYGDPQKADGPELFVDAYRHIHDVFIQEGAAKVLWVWCPNIEMSGPLGEEWNDIGNYYPGDEYVDWLCMDGYNWGTSQSWSAWQTFDTIFKPTYSHLQQINSNKPIMIGEFGASNKGGDKAAWVSDAFQRIRSDYPQIRAVFWFNVNKETDWRMDSSPDVLDVFKKSLAQPGWSSSWPGFEK
jgi:beta-mannanase